MLGFYHRPAKARPASGKAREWRVAVEPEQPIGWPKPRTPRDSRQGRAGRNPPPGAPETPLRSSRPSPLSGPPLQQTPSDPDCPASPHRCAPQRPRGREVGLTRRCSGLATLAAELHFVRPTIEKLRHNVVTQRLPFFMIANRKRYRGIHAGLLPPPCQGSAGIWQGSRVARCGRTRTTHWLAQPPSLAR